jgi:citrate (Re)-synthase
MNRPDKIWITDTTFRDGQQSRPPYETEQIVNLFKFLHSLSGPGGVIRQSEFFLYSDRDKKAVEKCLELGFKFPEITGWIRAVKEDFSLVKMFNLKETGILTSASDYHIYLKLKTDRKKALDKYLSVVDAALEAGITPRCHFEDITRADFDGFVIPFAAKLMERSEDSGIPVKIRACDTLGFGLPYANAKLPRSVPKIFDALHNKAGVPAEYLEWHGHNDFHKVLINGTTAWLYNCAGVNGTLLGWGERTGNPPIEGLIMDYISLNNGNAEELGIDTTVITEIGKYYREEIGESIPVNYPFVGEDFNTTRAGIHADGAIKDERIYNIFNTGKLLNRPLSVAITDKSGTAGLVFWLNSYFKLEGYKKLDKNHPGIKGIYEWITNQYRNNRASSISASEILTEAKKHLPYLFHSNLEGLKKKGKRLAIKIINSIMENHPEIASLKTELIHPILENFIKHDAFAKLIYIVDKNGEKLTDFISQPEDLEKYRKKLPEHNFSDRIWFKQALESEVAVVSDFYISKVVEELCITVSKAIKDKNNNILGVLGIDINFDNLIKLA